MNGKFKGAGNPFYGKQHSKETKYLISKNNGKGQAKVTQDQVKEIRKLYKETTMTQKEIGKLYGIAPSTTNQIITKRWWKDII
jgi:DNA-directed RNA polymerase specialized sigma subunit